ncbi:DUF2235 domain-containing protein [Tabrizicola sp. L79]|uniref:DUF2235 domain-containing protein n=1 Tax=Pseudotabrizicola sp. L79 TaxID=3118402 RepID=UPI002F93A29B
MATEGSAPDAVRRGPVDLVVILDGTMSSLEPGQETNAGLTFRLLSGEGPGPGRRVYYEPGLQWEGWRNWTDVAVGRGINRQIRRAYGWLASRYRPGDRIFLLGYSRGAYAVRSLAGVIDRLGLLRADQATERNITQAYRHYQQGGDSHGARAFSYRRCHLNVEIEMVGVWDTVKALGWRVPGLWMLTEKSHAFHNHHLGRAIRHGFHALAYDETRVMFEPVLWDCPEGWEGNVEQVWFRGAHADVGGHIGGFAAARPLANVPLVWMLERAEACGLALPVGWRGRFPCDATAPMVGTWRSWGRLFLLRRHRRVGRDRSEKLHPSVQERQSRLAPLASALRRVRVRGSV